MADQQRVLIIGGVATGPKTAARLKRLTPEADVTLIDRDSIVSYGACGLPYYVEGLFEDVNELINTPVGVPRNAMFFNKVKGFKVLTRTEALKIDRQAGTVRVRNLDSGEESDMPYDKLVIATGGYPFRPPIPGVDLKNVWFMTHPSHAESLVREIGAQGLKKAVLVGAGFIGIEMAEALIHRGVEVTIVEMMDQIMPGILDKDVATFAAKHLRQKGVRLVLGERVTGIGGTDRVTSVDTDKQSIETDLAVIAVGTRPNDALAREAGLSCMEQGGIVINEYCQTSDPDIYAGGDCVVNTYAGGAAGSQLFVALGSTANKHGRVIANHIAGSPTPFAGISCTGIVRAFDFSLGRTGLSEKQAKALNLDVETVTWAGPDMPHYIPGAGPFVIKMIASKRDRKLLGVQVAGMGNGAKRLDVAASMILMGGTLDDVANIDFGYAPPFSPPIDPLATCAHILTNKLDGLAKSISAFEARDRIEQGDVLLIDVRTPGEFEEMRLPYDVTHIPLGALRDKAASLPKDRDILAFCKVSMRGYEAQRILNAAGFDRVRFIEGGIVGWPFEVKMLKQ
ncbi:pyridine nucleotide-disulfide oxidoreductase [Desulfonema ishimotonii]|uniref:Pyridine nucleotide-disulfide oxidoreductase n=1 Tax=Desulfonema ishimotonii TaxID=45657 RepID=A0A401G2Z9_9BACT|nr:FAD-dependent oxidoreductase [Desulfonema ishimotonii]GBC63495.1 pyridine nucleotide-disulfide oxidoreductase [Desulfonema ishimotonii]